MISESALRALRAIAPLKLDGPLSRHTTFGIGGPADAYAVATTVDQLRDLVLAARHNDVPYFILGSGSNILVSDSGIRGLVIRNDASAVSDPLPVNGGPAHTVTAESGASFAALARRLARAGWAGLEWAAGIPGTLGGAVVYNAGAYGGCLADVLQRVRLLDETGVEATLPATDLQLTYRGSAFTRGLLAGKVVLSVDFHVYPESAETLIARIAELDAKRLAAQPRGRNAGSIFKNHPQHPAWQLIDKAGLRGQRIGDAQISPKHANFFMNVGKARAADVKTLMDLARARVRERFGLELEPEVALVGDWSAA